MFVYNEETEEIYDAVDSVKSFVMLGLKDDPDQMASKLDTVTIISYFLILKWLDYKEEEFEKIEKETGKKTMRIFPQTEIGQKMRWSNLLCNREPDEPIFYDRYIFPALTHMINGCLPDVDQYGGLHQRKERYDDYDKSVVFIGEILYEAQKYPLELWAYQNIINSLGRLDIELDSAKSMGLIPHNYEGVIFDYYLEWLTLNDDQHLYVPTWLPDMIVNIAKPMLDDIICEPTVGSWRAATAIVKYFEGRGKSEEEIAGFLKNNLRCYSENKRILLFTGVSFALYGYPLEILSSKSVLNHKEIDEHSCSFCFAAPNHEFDLDGDGFAPQYWCKFNEENEILDSNAVALLLYEEILRPRGMCFCVVPDDILWGTYGNEIARKRIVKEQNVLLILPLPSFGKIITNSIIPPNDEQSLLVFSNEISRQNQVYFYNLRSFDEDYFWDENFISEQVDIISDLIQRIRKGEVLKKDDLLNSISIEELELNDYTLTIDHYLKNKKKESLITEIASQYGAKISLLGDMADEVKRFGYYYRFEDEDYNIEDLNSENALFISSDYNDRVTTDVTTLDKQTRYVIRIKLKDEYNADFLTYFFNTENGIKERKLYTANSVETVAALPVPVVSDELWIEIIKTESAFDSIQGQLNELKYKFYKDVTKYESVQEELKHVNNAETLESWNTTLPFPVASILIRYFKDEETDYIARQSDLFSFFEAYAIFHTGILLSIINYNQCNLKGKRLLAGTDPKFFSHASFGSWVRVGEMISGRLNKLYKNPATREIVLSCFCNDEKLLSILCDKAIYAVLSNVSQWRNLWKGHSGVTSVAMYESHISQLSNQLRELRVCLKDLFERLLLFRAGSMQVVDNDEFEVQADILMGAYSIFKRDKIILSHPPRTGRIYLAFCNAKMAIDMFPVIIFDSSPQEEKGACYFYSRTAEGKTEYVSYYYENKPNLEGDNDIVLHSITEIITNNQ